MRSKIIPMINSGRIANAVRLSCYWKYGENPTTTPAQLEIYGIDRTGEHLIHTIPLNYIANEFTGNMFQQFIGEDYPFVYAKFNDNLKICTVESITLHSYITPLHDDSNAITELS